MQSTLDTASLRRKGHRLGIFVVIASFVVMIAGLLGTISNSGDGGFLVVPGFLGLIFGYPLARLWYWMRSA